MPDVTTQQFLLTAEQNSMLEARGAWIGIQADRAVQSSLLHFDTKNFTEQLARTNRLDALAGFAELKQRAANIGGMAGESSLRSVKQAERTFIDQGPQPASTLLNALGARTGMPLASILATNEKSRWDELVEAGKGQPSAQPAPSLTFGQLETQWNTSYPETPAALLDLSKAKTKLDDLLADMAGRNSEEEASRVPDWAQFQYDPNLYDILTPPDASEVVDILGMRRAGVSGREIVRTALSQKGKPYVWGGESPQEGGFDCSGLIQWSYARHGISLPRTTWQQVGVGSPVDFKNLRPGDAIYFDMQGGTRDANHVGMYIGNGSMIAAPRPGKPITIYRLDNYWRDRFYGARRFL